MGSGHAAAHIDVVVVAAQQKVIAEIEVLDGAVGCDAVGKVHPQMPPEFGPLLQWLDFLAGYARQGEQEGHGQVGPHRIAVEVGPVQRVPRRVFPMALEGCPGRMALGNHLARGILDGDSVRRIGRELLR
ncbi:hypothetical protein D3C80_1701110 [compost metagenome]